MKTVWIVLILVVTVSCAQRELSFIPDLSTTYQILDPETNAVVGTLRFQAPQSYVWEHWEWAVCDGGQAHVSFRILGHWTTEDDVLLLHDQTMQHITLRDRWGAELEHPEACVAEFRKSRKLPDCWKAQIAGQTLRLL